MAKLEDIVDEHTNTKPQTGDQNKVIQTTLEKELVAEDAAIAGELQRTRAEEIIALRRKRIAQLTGENGQTGEANARREQSVEQSLVDVANGLLEKGMEPNTVGRMVDYMLGNRQPGFIGMPGTPPAAQAITLNDVLTLVDRLSNRQPDPQITAILGKLSDEVKELKSQVANGSQPTGSVMVQQADGSFVEVAKGDRTIVIPRSSPPTTANSANLSLEEKKLDYQHQEKMEELKSQKERSEAIANTLAAIPEKIGEGLAAMALAKDGSSVAGKSASRTVPQPQIFICQAEGCGKEITVPPGVRKFKCPHCGQEYEGE
ncbi:MAG: hypothetical protein PHU23_00100 [Dehalococcoidales bacterium]|nr:hypothetical protein [Dehalococcoidales bacterium]